MRPNYLLFLSLAGIIAVALAGCGGNVADMTAPAGPPSTTPTVAPTGTPEAAAESTSAAPTPAGPITSAGSGNASTPIVTALMLSHAPLLQETATLTFTIRTITPVATAYATVTLPVGATLLEGDLEWQGSLTPEQPETIVATIRFVEEGNWTIAAKALSPQEGGDVWGDAAYIYLYVSAATSHPGFKESGENGSPAEEGVPTPPGVDAQP